MLSCPLWVKSGHVRCNEGCPLMTIPVRVAQSTGKPSGLCQEFPDATILRKRRNGKRAAKALASQRLNAASFQNDRPSIEIVAQSRISASRAASRRQCSGSHSEPSPHLPCKSRSTRKVSPTSPRRKVVRGLLFRNARDCRGVQSSVRG